MTGIVYINPGSGPVKGSRESSAVANMRAFCEDLAKEQKIQAKFRRLKKEDSDHNDGRYAFKVELKRGKAKRTSLVHMPGLPLEQVRFMDRDDQNIWHFPRLYVDHSSWVWFFALRVCNPEKDE